MSRTTLTELEQCVLGVVWRDGPLTGYEIAALFLKSLSPYWSGSAGSIYPLVNRLRARGLLRGTRRAWNGARKTMLSVTPKGRAALRGWLTPPLPPEAGAPSFDSVRTRVFFIEVLPAAQRIPFIADAERVVREQLERIAGQRQEDQSAGRTSEVLGSIAVTYELKARLRWLRALRRYVATGELPD